MAIDFKAIQCPQCGSAGVKRISDDMWNCPYCGAQFIVEQTSDAQIIYNIVHYHGAAPKDDAPEITTEKFRINPEKSKEDFVRKAWIALAKEDAPDAAFEGEFGEVAVKEHQVVVVNAATELSYRARIGYDREEPYIAYERYYEEVPYTTTERYYDTTFHEHRTRTVTKTKRVEKQRPVTRYRTVTDWNTETGTHRADVGIHGENVVNLSLDYPLFVDSMRSSSSVETLSEEEGKDLVIIPAMQKAIEDKMTSENKKQLKDALPGDHHDELTFDEKLLSKSTKIYSASEYQAAISYNGKIYVKRAFPFGNMKIAGDRIKNEEGLQAFHNQKADELERIKRDAMQAVEDGIWKTTKPPILLATVCLALSILVSIIFAVCIPSAAVSITLMLVMFAIGVGAFVLSKILEIRHDEDLSYRARKAIDGETARVNEEVENYSENYVQLRRELLDQKLGSLGFPPVTDEEWL